MEWYSTTQECDCSLIQNPARVACVAVKANIMNRVMRQKMAEFAAAGFLSLLHSRPAFVQITCLCKNRRNSVGRECSRVGQAVGEGGKELVAGQIVHQHPLAHRQGLGGGGGHHIALAGVHEHTVVVHAVVQMVPAPMEGHVQLVLLGKALHLQIPRFRMSSQHLLVYARKLLTPHRGHWEGSLCTLFLKE